MKANQSISDREWELIARSIYEQDCNQEQQEQISELREILPDYKERNQVIKTAQQVDLYYQLKKFPADEEAWKKIEQRLKSTGSENYNLLQKIYENSLFRYAAAVVLVALLVVSGYQMFYRPPTALALLNVTSGQEVMKSVVLPDGTLVSLNSNTSIHYPEKFPEKIREVSIEGEAFFEVKPNKEKPFIIHAGKADIKVLGTSFNVNAYPNVKQVEVIVETGRVQVTKQIAKAHKTDELILTPGDKGTLDYSSQSLQKTANLNPNFLSWKTRNLTFKATPLDEVVENLKKVYKVDISITAPEINGLLLTAQFNNYSLDFILNVIQSTFRIEVQHVNGKYILRERS